MLPKHVTVCTIFFALLWADVKAQDIDKDLDKINTDLDAIINKKIGFASTPDEIEYNKEIDNVQIARNNNDRTLNSLNEKTEAKKRFEYYESRRDDLKQTINKLLSLAENLNDTPIVNSLKNALTQQNNYKEFAIANALEQLVADKNNTEMPNNLIGNPIQPNDPSDLSNFLDVLSKFVRAGGHLFSPTVYNQISPYDSSISQPDNNLNKQLRELLKTLNKKLDTLNKEDYDEWLEWFEWF
ncbi:uncharacterized protein [Bactrocera oleae]|uniref:uncharacterized protein n=1 Tax=Bactrocera oleae TaxID=104688 RepID=UPI00387E81C8